MKDMLIKLAACAVVLLLGESLIWAVLSFKIHWRESEQEAARLAREERIKQVQVTRRSAEEAADTPSGRVEQQMRRTNLERALWD